jgi:hypothetical protein
MFSGTGFRIHGGNFYNVGGDINLHTHQHLTIPDRKLHVVASQSLLTNQGLEDGRDATIEDRGPEETTFQRPATSTFAFGGQGAGSERERAGVSRNPRHGMAARPAPYGALEFAYLSVSHAL